MKYKVICLCDSMYTTCNECNSPCMSRLSNLAKEYDYLIIDIGKVESMNSTLLSSVLDFREQIVICNPTPISVNIFSILGVDKFINVFHNVDEAVAYIEEGSGVRATVSHT